MKRSDVTAAQDTMRHQLEAAGLIISEDLEIEIADFGLNRFAQEGLGIVVRVNEPEYCSKWLTLLPGQVCPSHYHKLKKETFFVLQGQVELVADGKLITLNMGDRYTLNPGIHHSFCSISGAVIEEVSTHDENSDSYFENSAIVRDPIVED